MEIELDCQDKSNGMSSLETLFTDIAKKATKKQIQKLKSIMQKIFGRGQRPALGANQQWQ